MARPGVVGEVPKLKENLRRFKEVSAILRKQFDETTKLIRQRPNGTSNMHPFTTKDGRKLTATEHNSIKMFGYMLVVKDNNELVWEWQRLYEDIGADVYKYSTIAVRAYITRKGLEIGTDMRDELDQAVCISLMRSSVFKYDPDGEQAPTTYFQRIAEASIMSWFKIA